MLAVWLHVICIRMPHLAFRTRKHLRVSSSFWMSWHQGPNFQIGWRLTQSMFVWSWPPTPLKSQRYRRQHWSSMASNDLRNRFFFLVYGKIVWSKLATYNLLIWFKWLTCLHHNIICLCLLFNWLNSCRKKKYMIHCSLNSSQDQGLPIGIQPPQSSDWLEGCQGREATDWREEGEDWRSCSSTRSSWHSARVTSWRHKRAPCDVPGLKLS